MRFLVDMPTQNMTAHSDWLRQSYDDAVSAAQACKKALLNDNNKKGF